MIKNPHRYYIRLEGLTYLEAFTIRTFLLSQEYEEDDFEYGEKV